MINNPSTAKYISDLMMDMFARLSDSYRLVEKECSSEEFAAYRKATSGIFYGIVFEVMEPLYKANPDLKPSNWEDVDERPKPN